MKFKFKNEKLILKNEYENLNFKLKNEIRFSKSKIQFEK